MTLLSHIRQSGLPDTTKGHLVDLVHSIDRGDLSHAHIFIRTLRRVEGMDNPRYWYSRLMAHSYTAQAEALA